MSNTNYGLAGGTCSPPAGFLVKQHMAALGRIDEQLAALLVEDPTAYYTGEFDALLDRRLEISRQIAEGV